MNEPKPSENQPEPSRDEMMSALFANMVVQQANMALMFLGQVPHPESGQPVHDLDAAKMFIDQLEMLEVKTKGNLDKREDALLKRNLTALRLAFVETLNQKPTPSARQEPAAASGAAPTDAPAAEATESAPASVEAESRKKFSKKY